MEETDLSVTEQAHEWFHVLRHAGPQERAAFAAWLKASPRHAGEFLTVTAVYRHYPAVDPERSIDVEALLAEASSNVVPMNEGRVSADTGGQKARIARRSWRIAAVAAAVAGVAVAAGWWLSLNSLGGRGYESAIGEIRSFELDDGSVVHLNTRSKVRVHLTGEAREVWLLAGEALFKVAKDPGRPFRVHSGSTVIQALGTQFNVYRRAQGTTVAVIEGAVRVLADDRQGQKQTELSIGQGASIAADGKIQPLAAVDTVKVTAWRQRRLIFRGDTLADIAAEFNRYNKTPQFRVEGAATAALQFTGVFDAEAPESFIRVLSGVGNLSVEKREGEVVIRSGDVK